MESRDFALGKFQIGRITEKRSLNIGYPYAAGANLSSPWSSPPWTALRSNQLLAQVELPEEAVLTVTDDNGTILARHPDPQPWLAKIMPEWLVLQGLLRRPQGRCRRDTPRRRPRANLYPEAPELDGERLRLHRPRYPQGPAAGGGVEAAFARSLAVRVHRTAGLRPAV